MGGRIVGLLYNVLYVVNVDQEGDDRMLWFPSTKYGFQIKSFYRVLRSGGEGVASFHGGEDLEG